MRVFVAGASGVIGGRLVPLLVDAGHQVAGMTRSPAKAELLARLGAEPVVANVFDADLLTAALIAFAPDAVIHQLTDLPDDASLLADHVEANARIRREGTVNLLAAASQAGSRRFLVQSVAWNLPGEAGEAVKFMEGKVLEALGVVLRYGQLYGSGTFFPDQIPSHPRVHVDRAAQVTLESLDAASGVIEVIDVPAPAS